MPEVPVDPDTSWEQVNQAFEDSDEDPTGFKSSVFREVDKESSLNLVPIPTLALMAIKHKVSSRAAADLATAILLDYGYITPENYRLIVDKNKVNRAKLLNLIPSIKLQQISSLQH